MWEYLIVGAIVGAAAFLVGRRWWKSLKQEEPSCGCSGCSGCSGAGLTDLSKRPQRCCPPNKDESSRE
ncbi:MAG: FeoB-associated Cys-rich membrane protein [Desulfovibrionaceae bacterium]